MKTDKGIFKDSISSLLMSDDRYGFPLDLHYGLLIITQKRAICKLADLKR